MGKQVAYSKEPKSIDVTVAPITPSAVALYTARSEAISNFINELNKSKQKYDTAASF